MVNKPPQIIVFKQHVSTGVEPSRLRHHSFIAIITSEIRALVVCAEGAYSHV